MVFFHLYSDIHRRVVMAKKKKSAKAAEKKNETEQLNPTVQPPEEPQIGNDSEIEEKIADETFAQSGSDYEHSVFLNVQAAYEEAKHKREKYKKIGPVFVAVSGIAFLTLIFTLENKITFLIFWVITILYTVALMIRAEYKYHQFQGYLGLLNKEKATEETANEETEAEAAEELSDVSAGTELPEKEQEEQT